jgi:hypothetical protein
LKGCFSNLGFRPSICPKKIEKQYPTNQTRDISYITYVSFGGLPTTLWQPNMAMGKNKTFLDDVPHPYRIYIEIVTCHV